MAAGSSGDGGLSGGEAVFPAGPGFRRPLLNRGSTVLAVAVVAAVVAGFGLIPAFAWGVAAAGGPGPWAPAAA
jgi:hypothetical protein